MVWSTSLVDIALGRPSGVIGEAMFDAARLNGW